MSHKSAQQARVLLHIDGMSCAGCVRTVERSLQAVPDVASASVSFANQSALITGEAAPDDLISAVSKAGYRARPYEDESLEQQESQARLELLRSVLRSAVALVAGVVLMIDMHIGLLPPLTSTIPWTLVGLMTFSIMIMTGGHFYRGALQALRTGTATMDTLILLGTGAAWLFSMLVVLTPQLVPEDSRFQYFEAGLFIIGFVNLGKALESHARTKTSLAIQKLFDLTPEFASLITDDGESQVPVEALTAGDRIRLRPGDRVPVDGIVLEGTGSFDESMLTGESEPVVHAAKGYVRAGTINLDGTLIVEADETGAETLLAKMVQLVQEAQNTKPRMAQLVDQITAVFVPMVILIAMTAGAGWWLFGPEPQLSFALVSMMSVLIIACPCALGLAIPMSVTVGLGRAAGEGLLIRNSEVLQSAAELTTIVLDKTGTLTAGRPAVSQVVDLSATAQQYAAAVARLSNHPLSRAIADNTASEEEVTVANFESIAGGGLKAEVAGQQVLMGSRQLLESRLRVILPEVEAVGAIVFVAINDRPQGYYLLSDEIRDDAIEFVDELKTSGFQVVMLTGDRQSSAEDVARQIGITEVHSELLPEDKLRLIQRYQAQGARVGMVGDGINDAAALAAADVGFAMGGGTDVAMETADVTLIGNTMHSVINAISLAKLTIRNIYQNLFAASIYNLLLIPVAAGVLYPLTGTLINPALAGLAMAASSITVVLNAGRLQFSRPV